MRSTGLCIQCVGSDELNRQNKEQEEPWLSAVRTKEKYVPNKLQTGIRPFPECASRIVRLDPAVFASPCSCHMEDLT